MTANSVEDRLAVMESDYRRALDRIDELEARLPALEARLPATAILSPSFIKRAFAVWGHSIAAQFLVALPFILLYGVVIFVAILLSAIR